MIWNCYITDYAVMVVQYVCMYASYSLQLQNFLETYNDVIYVMCRQRRNFLLWIMIVVENVAMFTTWDDVCVCVWYVYQYECPNVWRISISGRHLILVCTTILFGVSSWSGRYLIHGDRTQEDMRDMLVQIYMC